jgi:hypothetical protein
MSSRLTLSIPFVLLGRRDVLNPTTTTTEPIKIVLQTLQQFCPTVLVHPWALDTGPEQTSLFDQTNAATGSASPCEAEDEWSYLTAEGKERWILRSAPHIDSSSSKTGLQDWRKGDYHLTEGESKRLDSNVWACPILLQRVGVSLDASSQSWSRFVQEAQQLFSVLKSAFQDFESPVQGVDGCAKYWDVVIGERCFLTTTVEPVDAELSKKVLMLQAAFEKELDMLRTVNEVIEFVGVSRWLEWTLLRTMAKEKREAWRALEKSRHNMEGKKAWNISVAVDEERYRRTKGREREWWDVIHDVDEDELLELMQTSKERGWRLGTAIRTDKNGMTKIMFQGQRSTLDSDYLIAYTELLVRFVEKARHHDSDDLAELLEDPQLCRSTDPVECFTAILIFLSQDASGLGFDCTSRTKLLAYLVPFCSTAGTSQSASTLPPPRPKRPRKTINPFHDVQTYIRNSYIEERKNMACFVERYDRAGGYKPTTGEKLLALLNTEERIQVKEKGKWGLNKHIE